MRVLLASLFVCLVALLLVTLFVKLMKREKERISNSTLHPARYMLVQISDSSAHATFVVPQGGYYNLVIGSAMVDAFSDIRGTVSITNSRRGVIYQKAFVGSELQECNWLHSESLHGYIMTQQGGTNELDPLLSPMTTNHVTITLERAPNTPASLWLACLQTWEQYRQAWHTNSGNSK